MCLIAYTSNKYQILNPGLFLLHKRPVFLCLNVIGLPISCLAEALPAINSVDVESWPVICVFAPTYIITKQH